jgi:hypothetical protein
VRVADRPTVAYLFGDDWSVERVRAARRQLSERDVRRLVAGLEDLDRAVADGNHLAVDAIVRRCPYGPVRDCLADLARHHLDGVAGSEQNRSLPTSAGRTTRRARLYRELHALCAPVDVWASTGYRHLMIDSDAFHGIDTNRFPHEPVGLLWRHRSAPVGLSSKWTVNGDGSLSGEFWIPPTREAQLVAQAAADGIVAPSIGVRFTSDWIHPAPDEWDPYTGIVDWTIHRAATVEEVSLTPMPQLPTRIDSVR